MPSRHLSAFLLAACAAALPLAADASARPNSLMPSAKTVLTKAVAAMKHKGFAHGVGTATSWVTRKTVRGSVSWVDSGSFSGDAAVNRDDSAQLTEHFTTHTSGIKTTFVMNYAISGAHMAANIRGHAKWACENTKTFVNSLDVWTPTSFFGGSTTSPNTMKHAHIWMGSGATVAGKAAWVVHISWHPAAKGAKETVGMTLYVDTADYLPLKYSMDIKATGAGGSIHMTGTVNLSNYGEKVHPALHGC